MHRWWPARRRPRLQLKVLRGGVWITWPGCEDDLFLRAGQSIWLPEPAWNSPLATAEGVLIEAEPRLSGERAVVMLVPATVTDSAVAVEHHRPPPALALGFVERGIGATQGRVDVVVIGNDHGRAEADAAGQIAPVERQRGGRHP